VKIHLQRINTPRTMHQFHNKSLTSFTLKRIPTFWHFTSETTSDCWTTFVTEILKNWTTQFSYIIKNYINMQFELFCVFKTWRAPTYIHPILKISKILFSLRCWNYERNTNFLQWYKVEPCQCVKQKESGYYIKKRPSGISAGVNFGLVLNTCSQTQYTDKF
jgi:hypothetical protein